MDYAADLAGAYDLALAPGLRTGIQWYMPLLEHFWIGSFVCASVFMFFEVGELSL